MKYISNVCFVVGRKYTTVDDNGDEIIIEVICFHKLNYNEIK